MLEELEHNPQPHSQSQMENLPKSFLEYRSNAQQHGPLAGKSMPSAQASLKTRSALPPAYQYFRLSRKEMDAVDSVRIRLSYMSILLMLIQGGATMYTF